MEDLHSSASARLEIEARCCRAQSEARARVEGAAATARGTLGRCENQLDRCERRLSRSGVSAAGDGRGDGLGGGPRGGNGGWGRGGREQEDGRGQRLDWRGWEASVRWLLSAAQARGAAVARR